MNNGLQNNACHAPIYNFIFQSIHPDDPITKIGMKSGAEILR